MTIGYFYINNKIIRATIPHLLTEPECVIGTSLDAGGDTEVMVKTVIQYAVNDVKTIENFECEDNSHIDCIDLTQPQPFRPLNLAYFYIAYHGMTWYEARFNAEMIDKDDYKTYRGSLQFLTNPAAKPDYICFLNIIGPSVESVDTAIYLEKLYNDTNTYREFFEAIPKSKRCTILYPWLNTFMEHYIGKTFSVKDWVINVHTMDFSKNTTTGDSLKQGQHYRIFSYKKITSLSI
jgi:hypothetical protein